MRQSAIKGSFRRALNGPGARRKRKAQRMGRSAQRMASVARSIRRVVIHSTKNTTPSKRRQGTAPRQAGTKTLHRQPSAAGMREQASERTSKGQRLGAGHRSNRRHLRGFPWESSPWRFLTWSARERRSGRASSKADAAMPDFVDPVTSEIWSSSAETAGETSKAIRWRSGELGWLIDKLSP